MHVRSWIMCSFRRAALKAQSGKSRLGFVSGMESLEFCQVHTTPGSIKYHDLHDSENWEEVHKLVNDVSSGNEKTWKCTWLSKEWQEIFESMVIDNRGIRTRFEAIPLNMVLCEGRFGDIDISAEECLDPLRSKAPQKVHEKCRFARQDDRL
jgi:hypothetical protein